jgi:transmembrane sensor
MNKELLIKYNKNACTEEELALILEWFEISSGTSDAKAIMFEIWEELPEDDNNTSEKFDLILNKIHHKVNLSQSKRLIQEDDPNLFSFKRRKHIINTLKRAAAILIFPLFCFGLYMTMKYQSIKKGYISVYQAYNEVFSSEDAITNISLPDGSNVWLNHSSSLKYPAIFQGDSRMVELTGEGYFEVAHNTKLPFIVKTGGIEIKAIGTVFNVMAYPDEDRIETSLIEGLVELQREEPDGGVISLLKMKPTDMAIFLKGNNIIETRTINDDRYFSWKEGKLVFNGEPMGEVVKKLSRWFNVDIQIKDTELLEFTYTATFIHETLSQVMELLAQVSPVNYSISNREQKSNGTYTKRKIILNYRKK